MERDLVKGEDGYGWTMYSVREVRENSLIVWPVPVESILAHMLKMLE